MPVITDAIIGGIAWEAFSKSLSFYAEGANDFVLRVYIAQQLRALEQLEGASDEQIEEITDIVEATVVETPDEIKEIEDKEEQKQVFNTYVKNIVKGNVYGVNGNIEDGATINQTFNYGDTHNHPNQ